MAGDFEVLFRDADGERIVHIKVLFENVSVYQSIDNGYYDTRRRKEQVVTAGRIGASCTTTGPEAVLVQIDILDLIAN